MAHCCISWNAPTAIAAAYPGNFPHAYWYHSLLLPAMKIARAADTGWIPFRNNADHTASRGHEGRGTPENQQLHHSHDFLSCPSTKLRRMHLEASMLSLSSPARTSTPYCVSPSRAHCSLEGKQPIKNSQSRRPSRMPASEVSSTCPAMTTASR